jgi:hypothetical protein
VRTSTDATFVLPTIVPSNQLPGVSVSVENQIATIFGGAFGCATGARGSGWGGLAETVRFDGIETGAEEHPVTQQRAPIVIVQDASRKGFRGQSKHKHDNRAMKSIDLLSPTGQARPSLPFLDLAVEDSGRPTWLDWLVTFAGLWIITGLFVDAHQHLFLSVESFFNPWHVTMYTGAIFAAAVLGITIARNYRSSGSLWKAIPQGYAGSVFGVVGLLVGGALDFIWHAVFGFEHQLDLLLSPPHLFLLSGLFFLVTGPVRSALARPSARRLVEQLPMLISLGLAFEIIQFCTQYGFYPEALLRDHPLAQSGFRSEQFVLSVFLFYKQSLEISTVIWQSLLLSAAVLYLCVRKQLRFGALIVVSVAVKLWICGEIANDLKEVLLVVLAAVAAGAIGDFIVAKLGVGPRRPNAFRLLGFAVPSAYFAAYFAFAVPLFGGTWWDASFVFGSIVEAGLVGLCISQLFLAGSQTTTTA